MQLSKDYAYYYSCQSMGRELEGRKQLNNKGKSCYSSITRDLSWQNNGLKTRGQQTQG